ncbi:MAG: hypothetical protein K2G60_02450 [Oscillospiraceae bacterium]|nr:hypothetical protein [Oscillospiraceae bacterium]
MKKLFVTLVLIYSLSFCSFAANKNRIPLTPTVTPLRIFFAALAVLGFILAEIYIERKREQRVASRPERAEKKAAKLKNKKNKSK